MNKNIGIVLAGGTGERIGADIPKQLIKIAGTTILEHTVSVFEKSNAIDEIIVMVTKGWCEKIGKLLDNKYSKLTNILEGGKTRNDTTNNMLKYLGSKNTSNNAKLILHDAVRPLLDNSIIESSINELENYDAIDVVITSADTIVEVNKKNIITGIPNRSLLRRGQTPQSFKFWVLKKAYKIAENDNNFFATDDCGVVFKYLPNTKIKCIYGNESNIKVTHPVDLFIADKLFQLKSTKISAEIFNKYKEFYKDKVVVVFGGSMGIGKDIVSVAKKLKSKVYSFSRSLNNTDITNLDSLRKSLEKVYAAEGKIDKIVLTAGVLKIGKLNDISFEEIENMTNVNYIAAVNLAKLSIKYLKKSHGHLLLFTSSSYTRGRENYALYSSAKAGIVNLTQALSEEWAKYNIKINVVNPSRTATPMRKKAFGNEPLKTLIPSLKVAQISIATMATDLTGQIIDIKR